MDAITTLIHKISGYRLHKIERYATNAEEIQQKQLQAVLANLRGTLYGNKYGITEDDTTYEQFRTKIPLTEYEPLREYVEQMLDGKENILLAGSCKRFAKSSGTSGSRSKFIPVNEKHLKECHFRGGSDSLWLYLNTRPDSRFFQTKGLVIGGSSTPVANNKNILQGDLSSILIEKMPTLGNLLRVPSKKTLLMSEWNSKMEAIVNEVIPQNIGSLSGVPSWMMVMIKKVLEQTGKNNLSEVWPQLEVFFHGGISFSPYRQEYQRLIPSERMQYRETYNASEGFFGIQNDPSDSSLLVMLDYGVFYEFIPLDDLNHPSPRIVPLWGVEPGVVYSMVISTLGGLYRYQIGDTVTFSSTHPYKFTIAGRTSHYINTFGEELMVANTDKAIAEVSNTLQCQVSEYTAAPRIFEEKGKGCHEWIIEFNKGPKDIAEFARLLDDKLREVNSDYDAKRYSDMTLLPLKLYTVPKGFFENYLAEIGKLGGQNKVPRLKNDRKLIDILLERKGVTNQQ